ncbi:cAMP-independent regulatory protein pac2 [Fulvia fulva]|nr:cAMP-independent regulatory protein pac2 [Fulvia fulva]KAK4615012.1 cAMP-independent regulatory protein pac2 [Fulvia fulva]WPV20081.1 cAMP-independent regulatory protein pac2 [Fulvia fulva]WPV35480.1 cAMP-independent regulatory protein pac2 [Fulvia fulva]
METYNGHVRTPADAIILFEACRIGLLPRVQRRLSEKERQSIKSGSVFVWDEREAGMRRWTDGKSWSASRVSGSFLTYREMEGKRGGGSSFDKSANRDGMPQDGDSDGGPDGYRYKPDGLMKQSFSITTNQGQHLHLISYFSRSATTAQGLIQPSQDPQLRHIRPEKGMYPDSTVHEGSNIPAVTRGPMGSPGHAYAPNQPPPYGRGYPYHHPQWPPSPMHTPPPHHYSPYYQHPHAAYAHGMHYPPPPTSYEHPGMTAFDRPPPMGANGLPPPPPAGYGQPPYQGSYPPPPPTYHSAYPAYQPPPLQAPPYPEANRNQSHEHRPSQQSEAQQPTRAASENKDDRTDAAAQTASPKKDEPQASSGADKAPVASGQTIPSISAMLNAGENGQPPPRTSSRSPTGPARGLQDIPSHKLGFEASRDVHTLRALDKTNFKF